MEVTMSKPTFLSRPPPVASATTQSACKAWKHTHKSLLRCGTRNMDLVKSLGADEVIDYKTPDGAALRSPSYKKYDAVLHCARNVPWSTFEPNLSSQGKVIDITPTPSAMMTCAIKKLTVSKKQLVPLIASPTCKDLEYLLNLVEQGKIKTLIDSKYPLSNAEDAWAKSMDGHATGKIIVEP